MLLCYSKDNLTTPFHHHPLVSEYSYQLYGLLNEPQNAAVTHNPAEHENFGGYSLNCWQSCCLLVLLTCVLLVLYFVFVVVIQKIYLSFGERLIQLRIIGSLCAHLQRRPLEVGPTANHSPGHNLL